jgi:hypothetical protein
LLQPNVIIPVVIEISKWDHQSDELYERFNSDHEKESAVALLEQLNEQKNRDEKTLSKKRITHTPAVKPGAY